MSGIPLSFPSFPIMRPRRLRLKSTIRALTSEALLDSSKLVYPLFISASSESKQEIPSLPGQYRYPVSEELVARIDELFSLGVRSFLLFGIPSRKDELGSEAYSDNGVIQRALSLIRERFDDKVVLITDVCLCEYTSHGHCGIVRGNSVDNDLTLSYLARIAVSHARYGVDMVAPSDMMDGRVKVIRQALDDAGFKDVAIMAYSAKYASALYGPFREAVDSAPKFGDRRGYQMDPRNAVEALREVYLDIMEGADIVMVKPALWYLDIVKMVKETFKVPVAAYSTSGEYAMIKLLAERGLGDERRLVAEATFAIRRAGADIIITYYAPLIASMIRDGVANELF
ncbi:MAG: porphobilinogen synthase [Candidatus Nezhaarchaeota archaeon]|nr:porphobilinogen synthase [Candidatus Nezhaarchaeota archaeon]MCX8141212.1 porphobilinogen synthase [Candidatus Nezhaarchaeota archaeon]MDW8049478.1 porphobilinogen synthase [Nitrososphaerota archaeon]